MNQDNRRWLAEIDAAIGHYITGFTDGEGSFNVSLRKRYDHRLGWQIKPSFNLSQRDRVILAWMKTVFGCGTLRTRRDGVVYYEVTNLAMLQERIIPFFQRFRFRSAAKKKNFLIFKQIIEILNREGNTAHSLQSIVQLREILNEGRGRKRKYEARHVLDRKSSETIR
ncbi:LAGLIDADG family homing endonuclease [Candidatus Falkowbacteria bacterium]|nr:LAGLIDADG family homing endonuclease [Candidatus Falkowbacteria bacterium]